MRTLELKIPPVALVLFIAAAMWGASQLTHPIELPGLVRFVAVWAVFLSNALAFVGPFFFVFYMNHFQIAPEEKALAVMFGAQFSEYKNKVRRWL